jgi:hypothetical protein
MAQRAAFAESVTCESIQALLCEVSIGNVKNIEHFQSVALDASMGRANGNSALTEVLERIRSANNY